MELLLLITPLPAILVGNKDMLPLFAYGKRRSKKWQKRKKKKNH
jgi:hypothetical protein